MPPTASPQLPENATLVYLEAPTGQSPLLADLRVFLESDEHLQAAGLGTSSKVFMVSTVQEALTTLGEQRDRLQLVFVIVEGQVNTGLSVTANDHSDVIGHATAPVDEDAKPLPVMVAMGADQDAEAPERYLMSDRPVVGKVVVIKPPFDPAVIRDQVKSLVANPTQQLES